MGSCRFRSSIDGSTKVADQGRKPLTEQERLTSPFLGIFEAFLQRLGESHYEWHRESPWPELAFLPSPEHERLQRDGGPATSADHETANALRPTDLVAAKADHVYGGRQLVVSHFSEALCGIDMEERGSTLQSFRELIHGLHYACFVVDMHERHDKGIFSYSCHNVVSQMASIRLRREEFNLKPVPSQVLQRFQNSLVFGCGRDNVSSSRGVTVSRQP